eukprot:CAMPEP_0178953552 /NCGR_PEP_ID=MMETSP0789-20121207/8481_1 /TAXON_ID=3005 /ORGANISM="Rhizosolenia setigera, Strain CCMP 1694" /LENGTH=179 /DNA_ID=CAMNT_0020634821 /DNA_START=131 /DNA_END=670 /DNA_ORIENTATION=-
MMKVGSVIAALLLANTASAFVVVPSTSTSSFVKSSSVVFSTQQEKGGEEDLSIPEARNPDRPELPELKNNFNWDEKFQNDEDWLSGPDVPGKQVMNEIDLASQVTALSKLEEKWRKERLQKEYDDARILGFTGMAETYNGRFAMFFLVVGLLTEYWTGITIPGQIEEMLRVGGFIGFDQ